MWQSTMPHCVPKCMCESYCLDLQKRSVHIWPQVLQAAKLLQRYTLFVLYVAEHHVVAGYVGITVNLL